MKVRSGRKAPFTRATLACAVALVAGCAQPAPDGAIGAGESSLDEVAPETDDAIARATWAKIGFGVHYKALEGSGSNALLVYGGYTAGDEHVQRWANELVRARGTSLEIKHVYAIKGPDSEMYEHREILNSRLAAQLVASGIAAGARTIYVVGHSSGSYVADELFSLLATGAGGAAPEATLGKTVYFNLDGGRVTEPDAYRALRSAYFVHACDATIGLCSYNERKMRDEGAYYAALGGNVAINANGSGCASAPTNGGRWCLHDAVITTRPHNPTAADLAADYTDFGGDRQVVTSWLDVKR